MRQNRIRLKTQANGAHSPCDCQKLVLRNTRLLTCAVTLLSAERYAALLLLLLLTKQKYSISIQTPKSQQLDKTQQLYQKQHVWQEMKDVRNKVIIVEA